jgi:flavin-dependent dehydrogenase
VAFELAKDRAYDVIVVGAGPAGSTSALLLAQQGRRVLLLDAARLPRPKACAEYISPGGVEILRRLGALDRLRTGCWLRGMEIIAPSGARHVVEYGAGVCGLSISRLELDAALVELARAAGATLRQGVRVRGLLHDGPRVTGVVDSSGYEWRARLVIGADGLQSVVARTLGVRRLRRWPRRLGLVGHFADVDWPEAIGHLWVGRRGYVAATPVDGARLVTVGLATGLPRRGGRANVARDGALVGRRGGIAEEFIRTLDGNYSELFERLRGKRLVDVVRGVGPMAVRVRPVVGPGYALVGDAAGFFDPFTGEGIFRALRGAELLVAAPAAYAAARRQAFVAKERLVTLIQAIIERPALLEFAIGRLHQRPAVARELGRMLGDTAPARLGVAWQLLGP